MHEHSGHAGREAHKAASLAAMAKETDAAGRARAFCRTQVQYFRGLLSHPAVQALPADIVEELKGDVDHYESEISAIANGIAHGVSA